MATLVRKPSAAERLASLRDSIDDMVDIDVKLKCLLYGASGVGKTVEAGVLAQMLNPTGKRILHIDTGQGWVSLKNHPGLLNNMQRMKFEGLTQIETLVDAIKAGVAGFDDYSVIIYDEFSTVARRDLLTVMDATLDDDDNMSAAEFKQYNIATRRMEKVFLKLLELKDSHHLILLAHERTDENKITKIRQTSPSFMDKFGSVVREDMHVVARMTTDVTNRTGAPIYKREMQVHPTKMVIAKSRIGGLEILVPPNAFNTRLKDWVLSGGTLEDEQKPIELEAEKEVLGSFEDQQITTGYEVE